MTGFDHENEEERINGGRKSIGMMGLKNPCKLSPLGKLFRIQLCWENKILKSL